MGARRTMAIALVALAGGGCSAALAATGSGDASGSGSAAPPSAKQERVMRLGIEVVGFHGRGRHLTADGIVRARVADTHGRTRIVRRRVAFAARSGGGCRILYLRLKQVNLKLLGLNIHLGHVKLRVTGHRHGGVLGKLFCQLASAVPKLPGAKASAARTLNRRMHRHPMHIARFRAHISPQARAAQSKTCPVLDLVLGPLHLNLLGLELDLNQVHLTITADPNGGALGSLFCQLSTQQSSGSGTTTTSTTTTATTASG